MKKSHKVIILIACKLFLISHIVLHHNSLQHSKLLSATLIKLEQNIEVIVEDTLADILKTCHPWESCGDDEEVAKSN